MADNKNRLACISIPAISIFLTIHKGLLPSLKLPIHFRPNKLFNMLYNKTNHKA